MNSPEWRVDQKASLPDLQKEKENAPIFMVRFGIGPHVIKNSGWHINLRQDIDSFFQSSDSPQRNILYIEDAFGSQTFVENIRRGYKAYKSWLRAYFWADLETVWRELSLVGEERFPPADKLDKIVDVKLRSLSGRDAENYNFLKAVITSLDEIIERKQVKIDLVTETRKNAQEGSSVQNTVRLLTRTRDFASADEMREWIMRMWGLRKLRDSKIAEDLIGLYNRAYKQKTLTRIYVSLGEGHASCRDLLLERLGKKPSHDISLVKGSFSPSYEFDEFNAAGRFSIVADKAFALLDSGEKIPDEEWQKLYKQVISPKKE